MLRTNMMVAVVLLAGCHHEQAYQPAQLPPPPGPPIVMDADETQPSEGTAEAQAATPPASPASPAAPEAPAAASTAVTPPPSPVAPAAPPPVIRPASPGHWVHSDDYGWLWVPSGSASADLDGVPYAYLYTPSYGWTWYVSPWGFGGYHHGPWVHHAWRPRGWGGVWVAPPHVVVRIGPRGRGHHR